MSTIKEYFAFISYQRKDEKIADSLRHTLEHYHLPSNVRKDNPSFPKTIYPIFRDALELSGGVLSEQIEQALEQSKYLIVICSPNSAKSPWVNKEIHTFIRMEKERKIIPFIIDGEPNSGNPDTECFPPALRELTGSRELLGININELGREAAAVKVVACMFGLKFDVLWQRFQREQRRKKWMIVGGAILFALVSLGIGLYIERKNVELDSANRQMKINQIRLDSVNWQMKINQSRAVAEKINNTVDDLGVLRAIDLLLEVYPDDVYNPNWPHTYDVENCLRKLYGKYCNNQPYVSDVFQGHEEVVDQLCYSPDGKYLASGGYDKSIRIWNLETGQLDIKPILDNGWITSLCYSPDGKYIASGRFHGTIQIWDVKDGSLIREDGPRDGELISSICYSPTGDLVAFGQMVNFGVFGDHSRPIYIWNIMNGGKIRSLNGHKGTINSISFSPDGRFIASASEEETCIRIWDTISETQVGSLVGHERTITKICYSLDGRSLISASEDKTIRIWDLGTYTQIGNPLIGHEASIISLSYSSDGKSIISGSKDGNIRIWKIETGELMKVYQLNNLSDMQTLCVNPSKEEVAVALGKGIIKMWNITKRAKNKTIVVGLEGFEAVCYSPNGRYIAYGGDDDAIYIWDIETSKDLNYSFVGHKKKVTSVCYSPDGKYIVSGSGDGTIRIWNAENGQQISLKEHQGFVTSICYSSDGKYIIFESNNLIKKMNVTEDSMDLQECSVIEKETPFVNTVDISPNSNDIIYGGGYPNASKDINNSYAFLFNGLEHKPLYGHRIDVETVCFSPDGKLVASGSADHTIRIWDKESGMPVGTPLIGHESSVSSICYSPDGKYLISGSDDGIILLWDMKTYKQLGEPQKGHEGGIYSVRFNPDGKSFVSISSAFKRTRVGREIVPAEIKLWKFLSSHEIIQEMHKLLKKRELTLKERQKYYLE